MPGYVVRQRNRNIETRQQKSNMQNWQQKIDKPRTCNTDMLCQSEMNCTKRFLSAAPFFIEDDGERSQDCMLDAYEGRLWFPVHPKPSPVSSKCTGIWILVLLQFCKRGSLKSIREGLSEGLLWLGTRPNHDKILKRLSRPTKFLVNTLANLVAPTPWIYADLAASLSK